MSKKIELEESKLRDVLALLEYAEYGLLKDTDDKVIDYRQASNYLRKALKGDKGEE